MTRQTLLRASLQKAVSRFWTGLSRTAISFGVCVAIACLALAGISHDRLLLHWMLCPALLLSLLVLDRVWTATAILLIAIAGLLHIGWPAVASIVALYPFYAVLTILVCLGSVGLMFWQESRLHSKSDQLSKLHQLIGENSRDAIVLSDLNGHRVYCSAAAEQIGDWRPEELLTREDLEAIHPDDRTRAGEAIQKLRTGNESAMIECRMRNSTGDYTWVEACLRIVEDPNAGPDNYVLSIVRDVSERKRAEQKLIDAYSAVEALAITDALTGLPNRRRFDQDLATEWLRGAREQEPLSLLMMDIDKFKVYNDTFGHIRGDGCLKQVAEACMDVIHRPGDLVARYGGEEFVVILPNTNSEGALAVANDILEAIRHRRLPHPGSAHQIVTVSIGCATGVPAYGKHATELLDLADRALYTAKSAGRNQVYAFEQNTAPCPPESQRTTPIGS
jgi:diguanylate cyclase (GGDEF)-like protein/PAS domain S-box-containing protein